MLETIGDSDVTSCGLASCQSPHIELEPQSTKTTDNKAVQALPKVDITWSNSFQFAQSLQRNFSFLDLNGDGIINRVDLEPRINSNVPQHAELYKLAKTLDNNYSQLSSVLSSNGGITLEHARKLIEFTSSANCENSPSFGGTMARSVAGGAVGGGVAAKLGGDKFSDGAGKGAAVGAVVGLLAYGIESARYKEFVRNRDTIDGFAEFKNDSCSAQPVPTEGIARNEIAAQDGAFQKMREAAKLVDDTATNARYSLPANAHKLPESDIFKRLDAFKAHFDEIDTDKDRRLSYFELAEAVRSKKFSSLDTATAAVLARNLDAFSRISDDGSANGRKIEMSDFNEARRIYEPPSQQDTTFRRFNIGAAGSTGAMMGCAVGGVVGLFTTAGTFSVPGCIAGAAILGGGAGGFQALIMPKEDPFAKRIGEERADNLREELGWLRAKAN